MYLKGWLEKASNLEVMDELLRTKREISSCEKRIRKAKEEVKQLEYHLKIKRCREV